MSSWPISVEEFTERQGPASRRPFSAALLVSLLVHGLVLLALLLWFDDRKSANRSLRTPIFDISLSRANATRDSGQDAEFVADTLAPAVEQLAVPDTRPAPAELAVDSPTEATKPTEMEVEEPNYLEVAPTIVDAVVATASDSTFQVTEITSEQTDIALQPVGQILPLSDQEKDMMEQQLRKWQDDFEILDQADNTFTWQQGKQTFHASVEQQAPQNSTDLERAIVEVSTEVDGVRMSTQLAFKRLAFSHYAQLVDRWDDDVSLSEDEIYGRFHSNSRIVVSPERRSEPKFSGKVTVAASISLRGLARKADVFLGGLETRVKPIKLPLELMSESVSVGTADTETGQPYSQYAFNENGQITFSSLGGFQWTTDTVDEWFSCAPGCFISSGEDIELAVEGVVKGTVVVTAEDTIRVTGDLIYNQHPNDFNESQDFLGLLSENYIEIAPPEVTGRGDLTIHGALYAKRRFVVRNFRSRNRGLLSLFGSLTAGSLSATEPRYATRIEFDPRFEDQRPPNFPLTDKFELDQWDKQWTIQAED